jgi:hypothetical protein
MLSLFTRKVEFAWNQRRLEFEVVGESGACSFFRTVRFGCCGNQFDKTTVIRLRRAVRKQRNQIFGIECGPVSDLRGRHPGRCE